MKKMLIFDSLNAEASPPPIGAFVHFHDDPIKHPPKAREPMPLPHLLPRPDLLSRRDPILAAEMAKAPPIRLSESPPDGRDIVILTISPQELAFVPLSQFMAIGFWVTVEDDIIQMMSIATIETLYNIPIQQPEDIETVLPYIYDKPLVVSSSRILHQVLADYLSKPLYIADDLHLATSILNPDDPSIYEREFLKRLNLGIKCDVSAWSSLHVMRDLRFKMMAQPRETFHRYKHVDIPLASVLGNIEENGFPIDEDSLRVLDRNLTKQQKRLKTNIYNITGFTFDVDMPEVVQDVLLNILNLAEEGAFGDDEHIQLSTNFILHLYNQTQHPILPLLWKYWSNQRMSHYTAQLPLFINQTTQRIHSIYRNDHQKPNLQQIPKGILRSIFRPPHEYHFLQADYPQVDLQLLAQHSGDYLWHKALEKGHDLNQVAAAILFDVPLEAVTAEQQYLARLVNLGMLYGIKALDYAKSTAQHHHPFLQTYLDQLQIQWIASEEGYHNLTLFQLLRNPCHMGPNYFSIQNEITYILRKTLLTLDSALQGVDARVVLQTETAIIIESHQDRIRQVKEILEKAMQEATNHLHFETSLNIVLGKTWRDLDIDDASLFHY